jgi:hypothetical protein
MAEGISEDTQADTATAPRIVMDVRTLDDHRPRRVRLLAHHHRRVFMRRAVNYDYAGALDHAQTCASPAKCH